MSRSGPRSNVIVYSEMQLNVRDSVQLREQVAAGGRVIYLSLLAAEIGQRFSKFIQATRTNKDRWLSDLELTDAVIHQRLNGEVVVYRGGSCTFPLYWSYRDSKLHISTLLPIAEGQRFSRKNLITYFANVFLQSSYEPNTTSATPLIDWRRIKRGAATTFSKDHSVGETVHFHLADEGLSLERIADDVARAFHDYGMSQHPDTNAVLELSGGFDSTLAAATAPAVLKGMQGVSVEFPYYEFRFEADTQIAVGNALGINRFVLDGTSAFPYSPASNVPQFDEPTVFVTGLKHAERVAVFASACGATRLYVGHGGDQLFSTDLLTKDPVTPLQVERGLFSPEALQTFKSTFTGIQHSPWLQRTTGCFVYDACIDVWMKEAYGLTVRTPFTDLSLFRAALEWSHWCRRYSAGPDKSILVKAMGKIIPQAVLDRKGKVAYDGVWLRGYTKHADDICGQFERTAGILEHIGISPAWLLRRVRQIAEWQPVSTKEILAAYAISNWLLSWGIRRPQDVTWID